MKLSIEIEMDNAAFDGGMSGYEVAKILTKLASKSYESDGLEVDYMGEGEQPIRDSNGSKCGHWIVTDLPEFITGFHD
jgi:hypothetical protein